MEEARLNVINLQNVIDSAERLLNNPSRASDTDESKISRLESNVIAGDSKRVKLTDISLMPFQGHATKQPAFWSRLQCTVNTQPIPDADKLVYLLHSLKDDVLTLEEDYEGENYPVVLEILGKQYGEVEKIKASLLKKLREVLFATDLRTSIVALKALENILQRLEAIDVTIEVDSIEEIINKKLPTTVLLEIYRAKRKVQDFERYPPRRISNIMIYRYTRVGFGISSSPFLLAAVMRYHLENNDSELAPIILENFYADNVITGIPENVSLATFYHKGYNGV
uniref:Reverse transcriptase domain-containing protein n=1 Tax=Syphacia muris TaxID=451379 RepID=A0A0N5A9N6_9BILA